MYTDVDAKHFRMPCFGLKQCCMQLSVFGSQWGHMLLPEDWPWSSNDNTKRVQERACRPLKH